MSVYSKAIMSSAYSDYLTGSNRVKKAGLKDMPSEFPKHMSYLEKIPNEQVRLKNWKDQLRKENNIRLYLGLGRDIIADLSKEFYTSIQANTEIADCLREATERMSRPERWQSTWVEDALLHSLSINSVPILASKIGWWGETIPQTMIMLLHSKIDQVQVRASEVTQFVDSLFDASNSMLTTHKFESVIDVWAEEASTCDKSAWLLAQYLYYRSVAIDRMYVFKEELMEQLDKKHLQLNLGEGLSGVI